jgi:hypothetical protein
MAHRVQPLPVAKDLADVFHCAGRRRDTRLQECLDGYLEANAFELHGNRCFRCRVGPAACPIPSEPGAPGTVKPGLRGFAFGDTMGRRGSPAS